MRLVHSVIAAAVTLAACSIDAQTDFDWMKLELLDQLVREHSGGRMGQYMANQEIT